jgi:hypothetical protein
MLVVAPETSAFSLMMLQMESEEAGKIVRPMRRPQSSGLSFWPSHRQCTNLQYIFDHGRPDPNALAQALRFFGIPRDKGL